MENQFDSILSLNVFSSQLFDSKVPDLTQAGVFESPIQYSKDMAGGSKLKGKKADGFVPETKHVSLVDPSKKNAEFVDGQSVPHQNAMICPHCQSPIYHHPETASLKDLLYKGREGEELEDAIRGNWFLGSYHY